jgi:hypothetical protein
VSFDNIGDETSETVTKDFFNRCADPTYRLFKDYSLPLLLLLLPKLPEEILELRSGICLVPFQLYIRMFEQVTAGAGCA